MTVWDDLVGQEPLVEQLRAAVSAAERVAGGERDSGMTHAWLFTGPPGSGRSNAARAFAAALLCSEGGCGTCKNCRLTLAGSHPDVTRVATTQLSIGVDEVRDLVRRAAMTPSIGRWQFLIVEDADRLTDRGADALLKSLEEPPARTIWLLCAPTAEDIVATVRSRCRAMVLRTPPTAAVAAHLMAKYDVDEALASFAARASQGHIGRARALATDEGTRERRREILGVPARLTSLGACMAMAAHLIELSLRDAQPRIDQLNAIERRQLEESLGMGTPGVRTTGSAAAVKDLESRQRLRAKRLQRDALDRYLIDLASYYRDVISVGLGSRGELVNEELRDSIEADARRAPAEAYLGRVAAVFEHREAMEGEVAPGLAMESLMLALKRERDG
jgi:DNA polymerase-3 subunit delta'